jgi:hypothetical protein
LRRIAILVALALVLGGLIGANQQISQWHYELSGTSGELLYLSTFDEGADWALFEGRLSAQLSDGRLLLNVGLPESAPLTTARVYVRDFDLRTSAQATTGPLNNGYGVIFRYQNPQNFYMFLVSSDGYYQVSRVLNDNTTELSTWIPSAIVNAELNVENHLRVVARGASFEFFINDQRAQLCIPTAADAVSTYREGLGCIGGTMQDALTDTSFASGQVGVIARSFDEPDVIAAFDNVQLYSP